MFTVITKCKKDRSRPAALNSPCVRVGGLREEKLGVWFRSVALFALLSGSGFVLTEVPQLARAARGNI